MVWRKDDPQGDEARKILWETVPYTRGRGLDVGCGPNKIWPHAIGVDSCLDTQLFGIAMQPDIVTDCTKLDVFASQSMNWVFSSHMLEHLDDPLPAMREMWRVLKQGGHLILYLPDEDEYPKVGEEGANPDHKWNVNRVKVIEYMTQVGGWDLVESQKRNEGTEYSLYFVFKKFSDAKIHRLSCDAPRPAKTAAVVRYGAWGDALQMTSILPGLKEQGYHVTLYTVPRAWEVVEHEPLIDRVVLQDPDQVPNAWLGPFWEYLRTRYDRFINLSESVEGTFLAMPGRIQYGWTPEARHMLMNGNYLEFAHKAAGVPYERPLSRFVATEEEQKWAKAEKAKIGAAPLIMWVLAGSSIHKVWEGIDTVLARIMVAIPGAKVVTVGDERCKTMIEAPWEREPRIVRRSGDMSIRKTLALAQVCDVVIGPETGVMSGVAMEAMPKIILLSHSTVENLTRDWVNTYSLSAQTGCRGCHKMVYGWDQCVRDDRTGTAQCMANITPDAVWNALCRAIMPEDVKITIPVPEREMA